LTILSTICIFVYTIRQWYYMIDMIINKSSPIPQYYQLQTWLIEQIEQGIFKPNDKIPTEEEINRLTGLARATIRQAIQNLVNMGYLARKRRFGTFVLDRNQAISKQTIIGVIVPDIRLGYSPELARGAGDEASNNRHSLVLCNTDDLFVKADFHADRLIDNGISGVIFIPTAASDEKNSKIINKFTRNNVVVVLADRLIPDLDIDFVTTDNLEGANAITRYLIEKGHRRIAITLSTLFSTERDRLTGYKNALLENNIQVDDSLIFTTNTRFTEEHYMQVARKMLLKKQKFTAIFAGHDRIAFTISTVAKSMGIKIPQDLSIVGYDDLPFTATHPLSLTTMRQQIYEIGQKCMQLILTRINKKHPSTSKVVLKSSLIERGSVLPLVM
jgi:LacI family transcriptional regulator